MSPRLDLGIHAHFFFCQTVWRTGNAFLFTAFLQKGVSWVFVAFYQIGRLLRYHTIGLPEFRMGGSVEVFWFCLVIPLSNSLRSEFCFCFLEPRGFDSIRFEWRFGGLG